VSKIDQPSNFALHTLLKSLPPKRHPQAAGSRSETDAFGLWLHRTTINGKELPMTDMTVVQDKMKAIAAAHSDYAKSSFEAYKAYLAKIATIKAPDQAIQLTTDHVKSTYETFVAESTRIGDMYKDFFKSAFEPMTIGTQKLAV
jgi:hypothetical protein